MPTRTSLVLWARDFADVLKKDGPHTSSQGLYEKLLPLSLGNVEDAELLSALQAVQKASTSISGLAWKEMYNHPNVFDTEFMIVMAYGMLYAELHLALDRYANHPDEMWKGNYYPANAFEPGRRFRYEFNANPHPDWDKRRTLAE